MTRFQKTMAAFALTLAAGVAVFSWQSRALHELRKAAALAGAGGAGPGVSVTEESPGGRRVAVRKATLLERVNAKLLESVKPEDVAGFVRAGDELPRLRIAARLSEAEKMAFATAFAGFDLERVQVSMNDRLTGEERGRALAEISAREKAWVAGQLGPERAAAVTAAEAEFERTRVEQKAARSVARVSQAVNLSAEQEARLQAGFVERGLNPAAAAPVDGMMIRPFGNVSVDRSAPDLKAEAQKVLTPEQWAAYTEISKAKAKADGQKMNWLTTKVMPSFLQAARAAAEE